MKKKLLFLLMIGSVVVASSCKKLKEATNQDITLTTAAVTITIDPNEVTTQVVDLQSVSFTTDLDALIKKEAPGFGLSNIKSLKIKTLTAEITAGSNDENSFANLEDVAAKISATGKTPFTATYTNPSTAKTDKISLVVNNNVDLKDLVTSAGLNYTLSAKVRKSITNTLTIKVVATYDAVLGL